ncbi:MAG: hypothetical protein B6D64_06215 [Bacteroidetes bacterium 4484_276]|nr:MAG: hypothetical protein B6D64_06215 [Bacteroidetes bacterium 4484_276]
MNKKTFFQILLAALMIFPMAGIAQKKKKVSVRATGSYASSDLTPGQTKAKAMEEAKRNALQKAGITETVNFTDFQYQFEDNEHFREIFQAISCIETGGEIIVDEIISEEKSFNEFGNMVIDVEIEATVFCHNEKADRKFLFSVEGIDEVYKNESLLQFEFTPTQPGFLKIFNVTDEETYLLYPYIDKENPQYNDDPDHEFVKRETAQFPLHPAYREGYLLEIDKPGKSQEFNILMFVYTKENIPYIEDVDFANMMSWIYSIPPNERATEQVGFVIKKGN